MKPLPAICVLAGGLGSRLGDRVSQAPKPLLEVAGEPFLVHQLRLLASHGASEVVLCVGYRGEQVEQRLGNEMFSIAIRYSHDGEQQLGTLGAIRKAHDRGLLGERFLVLYGDTYLRVDYQAAVAYWIESGCCGLMVVLRNENRWEPSNVVYRNGRVVAYDKQQRPTPEMHWIDYGLGALDAKALALLPGEPDLSALYRRLAELNDLAAYEATERFYEIGRPASLAETENFLRNVAGIVP